MLGAVWLARWRLGNRLHVRHGEDHSLPTPNCFILIQSKQVHIQLEVFFTNYSCILVSFMFYLLPHQQSNNSVIISIPSGWAKLKYTLVICVPKARLIMKFQIINILYKAKQVKDEI